MGNVNMEATQIHDRTEAGKHQSVAEHLKALDALAQQIEDMPAYTSSDRAWLDEWESKLPELPADPETDGVKVLTATTTSGETVKSWEEPESGGGVDYSTNEVDTGIHWIDGKNIYRKVFVFENVAAATATQQAHGITGLDTVVRLYGVAANNSTIRPLPYVDDSANYQRNIYADTTNVGINGYTNSAAISQAFVVMEYTKSTT